MKNQRYNDPILEKKDYSETTRKIIDERFRRGFPTPIRDERCTADDQCIMVYPDGREELIVIDPESFAETVLKVF